MDVRDTADAVIKKYHPLAHANGDEIEVVFGFGTIKLRVASCEREMSSIAASQFARLFNVAVAAVTQEGAPISRDLLSARAQGNSVILKSQALGTVILEVVHAHSSSLRRIALLTALAFILVGRVNEPPK